MVLQPNLVEFCPLDYKEFSPPEPALRALGGVDLYSVGFQEGPERPIWDPERTT